MEPLQAFVLTDDNKVQLISLTRHCILHAVQALQPSASLSSVLPKSGTHKVESFCAELCEAIVAKQPKKRASSSSLLADQSLLLSIDIHKFCDGATSPAEFTTLIEERLVARSKDVGLNLDKLHKTCWNYYEVEKKSRISHPKWLSPTCTYRLWLIFNCVLDHDLKTFMTIRSLNEVLRRIIELCGYTWNDSDKYDGYGTIDFPHYLDIITGSFDRFKFETMLTCEVIGDMVDEIVHGVLKKGYLTKKGHKRTNWKRRWFILQRTTMSYYESREKLDLKGKFVLNSKTKTMSLQDKGKRRYLFEVTCGSTGKPFEICADDQRMKQEWILAIRKAIALAAVLEGSAKEDNFTQSLAGFYLLKYGTPKPALSRQDSTIRTMKYQARKDHQRKRLSGKKLSSESILLSSRSSLEDSQEYAPMSPQEEYVPMAPIGIEDDDDLSSLDSSGGEEEQYEEMSPLPNELEESTGSTDFTATMSLPLPSAHFEPKLHPHSLSFSGRDSGFNRPPPIKTRTFTQYGGQQPFKRPNTPPAILEPHPREEEEDEDKDSYEEADPNKVVSYKLGVKKDNQLGGYIEMTSDGKWRDVEDKDIDYAEPPDEKEEDLLKPAAAISPVGGQSTPKYLTLVRESSLEGGGGVRDIMVMSGSPGSPMSPSEGTNRPAVPPHRRSLPPEEITPPPISPRHSSVPSHSRMSNGHHDNYAPPLPPRTIISPHHSYPSLNLTGVPLPFPTAQHPTFHHTPITNDPPMPGAINPAHSERLRASSDFEFDPQHPPPLPPR